MADKAFKCTQCDASYDTKTQLSGHMRKHSTKPKKAKQKVGKNSRYDYTPIECPECGRMCLGKNSLGKHRGAAHGVISKSQLEQKQREQRLAVSKPTPTQLARTNHEEKQPSTHERKGHVIPNGAIDPLIFALAIGQAKEFCRHIAEEHDVPTRLFTREFAELFLRQTRR